MLPVHCPASPPHPLCLHPHLCPRAQSHPKFKSVAAVEPLLYSRELQMGEEKKPKRVALGDAVEAGTIANETLAYFIGRTHLFCMKARAWRAWFGFGASGCSGFWVFGRL